MLTTIALCVAAVQQSPEFERPVRMRVGSEFVRTEPGGYSSPSWADVDGDGHKDLLVGQYEGGRIRVYRGSLNGALAKGEWLLVGNKPAEVPGVW